MALIGAEEANSCATTLISSSQAKASTPAEIDQVWLSYWNPSSESEKLHSRNILWSHYYETLTKLFIPNLKKKKLHPMLDEGDLESQVAQTILGCIQSFNPTFAVSFENFCGQKIVMFTRQNLYRDQKPLGNRATAQASQIVSDALEILKTQGKWPFMRDELLEEVSRQLLKRSRFEDEQALQKGVLLTLERAARPATVSLEDDGFKNEKGQRVFEPSFESAAERNVEMQDLIAFLSQDFSARDQIIIELLFQGRTQAEIATELHQRGVELLRKSTAVKLKDRSDQSSHQPPQKTRFAKARLALSESLSVSPAPTSAPTSAPLLNQRDWLLLSLQQLDNRIDGKTTRQHDKADLYLDPGEPVDFDSFLKSLSTRLSDRDLFLIRLAFQSASEEAMITHLKTTGFKRPRLPIQTIFKNDIRPALELHLISFSMEEELRKQGFSIGESRVSQILNDEILPALKKRLEKLSPTRSGTEHD